MAKRRYATVRIPKAAWRVLKATLEMDSGSSAFDPDLRRQISKALKSVKKVKTEEVPLVELREAYGPEYGGFSRKLGPKEWSPRETVVTLRVPEEEWDTLAETLYLDSESGAYDEDLREMIASAFDLIIEE